jgi:predicted dehydrogenase
LTTTGHRRDAGAGFDDMAHVGTPIDVTIVGGGMITNDLILPSVYQLQRLGQVGRIRVAGRTAAPLDALAANLLLREAFPDASFESHSSAGGSPDGYRAVLDALVPRQAVIVAVPDALHSRVVMDAVAREQHVIAVKPLVRSSAEWQAIDRAARERGLYVGVEYHKRFDRRALVARRRYAEGRFGTFVMGEARLHEPYAYRRSNFQNWFTCDAADPFTYVGCHYVDLVSFITGLAPAAVSVDAVRGRFPNGNEAYLWASGRVRYENGALLTVTAGLGYPDAAAGANDQGMVLYGEGPDGTGMIHHDDHERGVRYSDVDDAGAASYRYVNPDFFQLVSWDGPGLRPVGYGYESIAAHLAAIARIESAAAGLGGAAALTSRQQTIAAIDAAGFLPTVATDLTNTLVAEAARLSIANAGALVRLYAGDNPRVERV